MEEAKRDGKMGLSVRLSADRRLWYLSSPLSSSCDRVPPLGLVMGDGRPVTAAPAPRCTADGPLLVDASCAVVCVARRWGGGLSIMRQCCCV